MRIVKSAKKRKQNKERPRHAEIPKQIFKVFLFLQQRRKIRRFYFGLALQTRTGFRLCGLCADRDHGRKNCCQKRNENIFEWHSRNMETAVQLIGLVDSASLGCFVTAELLSSSMFSTNIRFAVVDKRPEMFSASTGEPVRASAHNYATRNANDLKNFIASKGWKISV